MNKKEFVYSLILAAGGAFGGGVIGPLLLNQFGRSVDFWPGLIGGTIGGFLGGISIAKKQK